MPRFRFVQKLTGPVKQQLDRIYRNHPDFALRRRAHAILLSDKGCTIGQLQEIFEVDRDTVSLWLNNFEKFGVDGLKTRPRPGRPRIYTDEEIRRFKAMIDQEPRQIKIAQATLEEVTGKSSCAETLKRALKKNSIALGAVG